MSPKYFILSLIILFTSCVKDVDFDQSDDLLIEPNYKVALVQFKINPIIPSGVPSFSPPSIVEKVPVLLDKFSIGSDKIKNATIKINGINTFDTDVEIVIEFYKDNIITYKFQPMIISKNTSFSFVEVIDNFALNSFASSNEVSVKVLFQPFVPINLNPELNFQMSGEFEITIRN